MTDKQAWDKPQSLRSSLSHLTLHLNHGFSFLSVQKQPEEAGLVFKNLLQAGEGGGLEGAGGGGKQASQTSMQKQALTAKKPYTGRKEFKFISNKGLDPFFNISP